MCPIPKDISILLMPKNTAPPPPQLNKNNTFKLNLEDEITFLNIPGKYWESESDVRVTGTRGSGGNLPDSNDTLRFCTEMFLLFLVF